MEAIQLIVLHQAIFKGICEKAGVPCQVFVNSSDMRGGTTIGPITAGKFKYSSYRYGSTTFKHAFN